MTVASIDRPAQRDHTGHGPLLIIMGIVIVAAPLFNAGLQPLHLLLLQWLGLVLIGGVLWRPRAGPALGRVETLLLAALFLFPLLYLIPWPADLLALLPGRDNYEMALATMAPLAAAAPRPLSLHPFATESAWLVILIPLAVYLASRALDQHRLLKLSYLFFAIALFQVMIGVFQFATDTSGVDYALAAWGPPGGGASGTYLNRNHLAGLLEMAFPLALALFLYHFGRGPHKRLRTRSWQEKTVALLRAGGRPSLAFGLLAVIFLAGIVVTRSRTGIAMAMIGIILMAILFARHIGGGGASIGLTGRVLTLAIAIAFALGLAPVLDRFALSDMEQDARWPLASATLDGAGALLPLGSGPGTYPDAFPTDQPVELGRFFVNHAHNDYLEALYETGVWALILLVLFLALLARQWSRLLVGVEWSRFRCLQIGAGAGILLLLGHSLTDYNLHTPANLAYFALLAGIFFSPPGRLPLTQRNPHRKRRTHSMRATPTSVPSAPDAPDPGQGPSVEQTQGEGHSERRRNPFDD